VFFSTQNTIDFVVGGGDGVVVVVSGSVCDIVGEIFYEFNTVLFEDCV
jgi:hypothetical protein